MNWFAAFPLNYRLVKQVEDLNASSSLQQVNPRPLFLSWPKAR